MYFLEHVLEFYGLNIGKKGGRGMAVKQKISFVAIFYSKKI